MDSILSLSSINSQPSTLRKAGRYKLAAPVSKTGSVLTEVGAIPTPSANLTVNHRRSHASRNQISKPVALSKELSAKTKHYNSAGAEAEPVVPPIARRPEI